MAFSPIGWMECWNCLCTSGIYECQCLAIYCGVFALPCEYSHFNFFSIDSLSLINWIQFNLRVYFAAFVYWTIVLLLLFYVETNNKVRDQRNEPIRNKCVVSGHKFYSKWTSFMMEFIHLSVWSFKILWCRVNFFNP